MEKIRKILSCLVAVVLILIVVAGISLAGIYVYNVSPIDASNTKEKEFIIESGWGKNKIVEELKNNDLIRSTLIAKLYLKLNEDTIFYPGTFKLSKSMSLEEIITSLTDTIPLEEQVTITFVEGKRFPYYVNKISQNFSYEEEEILKKTSDQEYLKTLINKYWFITDDILNKELYYPLEGYLFPDTYTFKKDAKLEEIIDTFLVQMDKKLSNYKEVIENKNINIHDLLTMASMVELEAVTGIDRKNVVSVFNNRISNNMTLGSDVTTYYASKKELTESLTTRDLSDCNAYNTRGTCVKGLPVGPIACVSVSSIDAVLYPEDNDYLYFVADKNNKLYFAKDQATHDKIISDLRKQGLWLD